MVAIFLRSRAILVMLAALTISTSCTTNPIMSTAGKNVHIYNSVDLSRKMRGMSDELFVITTLTTQPTLTTEEHQELHKRLQVLSVKAQSIGDGITNYSVINQYMGAFIYDVEIAKQFANKTPPNYVPANRLVKSCISCHSTM